MRRRNFLATSLAAAGLAGGGNRGQVELDRDICQVVFDSNLAGKGLLAVYADGLDAKDSVDPTETTTPVQDAIDVVAGSGGGVVVLPPTPVQESETIKLRSSVSVYGHGVQCSIIEFTQGGIDGIHFDSAANGGSPVSKCNLDGFSLMGPWVDGVTETGSAMRHVGGFTHDISIGHLMFSFWTDAVYRVDRGVAPFQITWEQMTIYECDAGDSVADNADHWGSEGGLIIWDEYVGPANVFGIITAYPVSRRSGVRSNLLYAKGGDFVVGHMNLGESIGSVVIGHDDLALNVEHVNWEPSGELVSFSEPLFKFAGCRHRKYVGNIQIATDTAPGIVQIDPDWWAGTAGGNVYLGTVSFVRGDLDGDCIRFTNGDIGAPVYFEGTSDGVNNETGSELSHPVVCLAEGAWKTSTGTGLTRGVDRYVGTY